MMKVFKFGGASVKDANEIKNLADIVSNYADSDAIVVISAMGKTTNAFEAVLHLYMNKQNFTDKLSEIKAYHTEIAKELFTEEHTIFDEIINVFNDIKDFLNKNKSPNYDFIYDQIVSKGEILSTKLVSAYLNHIGIKNQWIDAHDYIKTDDTYREALVDWEETSQRLNQLDQGNLYITQGFIASNENHFTTTLGREGSDYSGAIISYCLNAESLTIWKDVPGVLNADPRFFENTKKLEQISYNEAIELAYYGASVIHPKTLKPLQNKDIPLYVKSFKNPKSVGTIIKNGDSIVPKVPCYIIKQHQFVWHISTKDFSFIDEKIIRDVFNKLTYYQLKVNLMQISAIGLSLCIEDKFNKKDKAFSQFQEDFMINAINDCTLYTVRHYTEEYKELIPDINQAIIQQIGKSTLQVVIKN